MSLPQVNEQSSALKQVRMVEEIQTLVKRESLYRIPPLENTVVLSSSSKDYEDHLMDGHEDEYRSSPRNVMYSPPSMTTNAASAGVLPTPTVVSPPPPALSNEIQRVMREKICQWMYRVVDFCDYDRKVTFIAINYVDRYLRLKNLADLNLGNDDAETFLQLLGLTALYVSCKTEGCPKCSLSLFVKLGSGRISANDIKSMEVDLMFTLKWLMNPPIPQEFTEFYTVYVSKFTNHMHDQKRFSPMVQDVSNYIIEVIIQYNLFQCVKSSLLGAVATLIALDGVRSSVMSFEKKQEARTLFLTTLVELGVVSSVHKGGLGGVGSLMTMTTIEDILNLESKVRFLLEDQCSSMVDICKGFDPDEVIYDSSSTSTSAIGMDEVIQDPPQLVL